MKRSAKRYLAMLLVMTMALQQGSAMGALAGETEPTSETAVVKTTEAQPIEAGEKAEGEKQEEPKEPEVKAPETKPEETKSAEDNASETKPEEPKEEENKTSEPKSEETSTTEPKTDETATEPGTGDPEKNTDATEPTTQAGTESETVTEKTTEGTTQTPSEPETEEQEATETEAETDVEAAAELDASVMQEVFQKTVDDATVPMVKYTVKLTNRTETADAEGVSLKVLLADALSYKKEEGETPELISFGTLGSAMEAAAFENGELSDTDKAAYANGGVVLWKDQKIAAGAEKTFVFCAEVKDGQTDVNALKNLWLVNGKAVADEKLQWTNTELLEVKKELPSEFTYENDNMIVTATLAEGTILPEGAQFVVEKVELSDEEKAQVEAVAAENKQLANYVAYDMHFEVDGEEVEPQGEVAVKVEYKEANAEDFGGETLNADAAELQVIHLDEQAGAEDVTAGAEVSAEGTVSSAEFVTDSFSVFVLSQMVDVDRTFVYEDDDVKITAVAGEKEELLNSNLTELKLEIVEDRDSKEYKELEKAVEKTEKESKKLLLGLRAYKFSFLKDGEEIEPTDEIEVTIKHKTSSIPEDISENSVDSMEFYQISENGSAKPLKAEAKTGRYHAVKKAIMSISGDTLIETISDERTVMSRAEILNALGIAKNFGVFAINFDNNQDMEGNVAIQHLKSCGHTMGPSNRNDNDDKTIIKLKITKKAQVSGTYSFGIFEKDATGAYVLKKEISVGVTELEEDGWYTGSTTVEQSDLPRGEYYVFEMGEDKKPLLTGNATVDGKDVSVSYETSDSFGTTGTGLIGKNTSYIEFFEGSGYDGDTFRHEGSWQRTLVIGSTNEISDKKADGTNTNEGEKYVVGKDGARYKFNVSTENGTLLVKADEPFPIDFEGELKRLAGLSEKLANVASSNEVKVVQIDLGGTDDMEKAKSVTIDGEPSTETNLTDKELGTDGKLLIINVDCTGSSSVTTKRVKIDGLAIDGWVESASRVIWNFYTKDSTGAAHAFTGTVTSDGGIVGTILTPSATYGSSSGLTIGTVIATSASHGGNEIHHKQIVEVENTVEKKVVCTNSLREKGSLEVKKTVSGSAGDKTKEFHFTVTLNDKTVNGVYGGMTFTDGVAEFTLKDGETRTADDLPAGVEYTVTEKEADADGYTTDSTGASGKIPVKETAKAAFTNTKDAGGLVVKKTVAGNKGDKEKEFSFTVTLTDRSVNGTFGDMTFENGVAKFTLKHGQSKSATGLAVGVGYTVTEADYSADGYETTYKGETGTISDGTQTASFTNTKNVYTRLTVTKTFDGATLTERQKGRITFTVYGPEKDGNKGPQVASFTYADMKDGSYTVELPETGTYTVEETSANVTGYHVTTTYMVGEDETQKVAVTEGATASMDVTNRYIRNTGIVLGAKKVFKAGESELALEGGEFTFSLTEVDEKGAVLSGGVSQTKKNKEGGTVEFDEIKYTEAGTYYYLIKEVIPTGEDKDGTILYATNSYTVKVTVEEKDEGLVAMADKKAEEIIFTNALTRVAIDKTDKESGVKLAGAKLQIVDNAGAVVVGPWTTDGKPYDVTGKLEVGGTYKLVELEAPAGYTIAAPVEFSVNAEGKFLVGDVEVTTVTMQDTKNRISILKVDENDTPLAGAKLIIKDADGNPVDSWTTDGKAHEITGLAKGTYTLSELEAPEGYQVSKDVPFEITGNETKDAVLTVKMIDTKVVETSRSLQVTKQLRLDGISPEAKIIVKAATYYVALFEDEARTQRVTDVKKIVFSNEASSSVTFDNLEADKTYYVGETDENGTLIPGGRLTKNLIYYPLYDSDAMFKFEGEKAEGESLAGLTNVYVELPDDFYLAGQLTVTKKVLVNGETADSDDVFYAAVFADAGLTQMVGDVLTLDTAGGSETSATVTNLTIGNEPGSSRKYYVAETDENGTPLDPDAITEYTISVDKSEITLSGYDPNQAVVITNDFVEEEESEFESESETEVEKDKTAPKTGDDTDFMKYLLLMAFSAGLGAVAIGQKRRKAKRVRK